MIVPRRPGTDEAAANLAGYNGRPLHDLKRTGPLLGRLVSGLYLIRLNRLDLVRLRRCRRTGSRTFGRVNRIAPLVLGGAITDSNDPWLGFLDRIRRSRGWMGSLLYNHHLTALAMFYNICPGF
jgi:hypothetical protein